MYFIRLFISNQLGQSKDLTLKKKVLRFCRKHIAFLMANSCIFKNIIQKRVVKYWAINLELKFLYESIHHSTEGLENFLSKLSLKELLNTELTFSRLVEIQKERIRKSIDPNKKTVAICFTTHGYREHVGNVADKLRIKGYNVIILLGGSNANKKWQQQKTFYIPNNMLNSIDFVNVFISPQIKPFDHLTFKGKVVHFFHDIHDSALPDIENHYRLILGVDYYLLSSHFLAKRLKHLITMGKKRVSALKDKKICLIKGGYIKLDNNIEYFKKQSQESTALIYAPTLSPKDKMKEMKNVVATHQHSDEIIKSILHNFTEYDLIYRPHPHTLELTEIKNIAKKYMNHPRFNFDDNVDFYMDNYSKSALMITDMSGTAYTYAFTTLRPVIFFSHNEDEVKKIYSDFQYFIDRNKIGYVAKNVEEVLEKIKLLLDSNDEFKSRIKEYRDSSVYNIGKSEDYFVENINYIIEDKKNPDWIY